MAVVMVVVVVVVVVRNGSGNGGGGRHGGVVGGDWGGGWLCHYKVNNELSCLFIPCSGCPSLQKRDVMHDGIVTVGSLSI